SHLRRRKRTGKAKTVGIGRQESTPDRRNRYPHCDMKQNCQGSGAVPFNTKVGCGNRRKIMKRPDIPWRPGQKGGKIRSREDEAKRMTGQRKHNGPRAEI